VNVNGGVRRYRACRAETDALRRARRPKLAKLALCSRLRAVVEAKLELRWSPQQISGCWRKSTPTIRRCACRTRRSMCRCSFSRGRVT
jgi:IS30 family transposase